MNKTKIEWCDYTWSPVTGCLYGCPYCYARRIAHRFAPRLGNGSIKECRKLHDISDADKAFLFGFDPTFHSYRLEEPQKIKKPSNIFVCSMADLFGDWVPNEWIRKVFEACQAAPQHRYLFLTKNPNRYYMLGDGSAEIIPDGGISGWFGASASTQEQAWAAWENKNCSWMSLEPLHGEFGEDFFSHTVMTGDGVFDEAQRWSWIVIGSETGNRRGKIIPKREWIQNIVEQCKAANIPVFMKNSLKSIWGEELIQELPWR